MTMPDSTTLALVGIIAALWLAAAVGAVVRGLTMQRRAAYSERRAHQLAAMIEVGPSRPLIVRSDGRIEGGGDCAALFGFDILPSTLDALLGQDGDALTHGDGQALAEEVRAAQRTGKAFTLTVQDRQALRTLKIRGGPLPPSFGQQGAALLWVTDASADEARVRKLQRQRSDAVAAFDAISALIEAAPFPMWFRDTDLSLALVNRAYVEAAEAGDAQEVVARQTELIEPVAGVSARDAAKRAGDAGEPVTRIVPVTVSGERRIMEAVDVPIAEIGVAGYAVDRQELEDVRAEYRRFADARRSMLDQMSAAVAEFGPDRQLRFVNRPFLRLFLVDEEWAASAPPFERLLDRLRDNGRTPEVRDFPSWRAERRGWFAAADLIEESWMLRDGTHLRTVAQPTPDGGLLLVFEDRTEQLRLASARDTLLRVRTATFDNLYEAVAVFAPDGKLHLWNQRFRRLWDVPEEYLTAHPRVDALMERIAPRLRDPRQQGVVRQMIVGAAGERQQRSGRIEFREGQQFDFSAIPLPDGNALFTLIDVTDSRRIERALRERAEALEAADKVKTDFLSRISYELRTPLTSIGGFAEMLQGGYAGELSTSGKSYVQAILDSTAALGAQIDTVLDLAQSEAGTLPLERRPIALDALVRAAAAAFAEQAKANGIDITLELKIGLGTISGDAKRLRQAIDQVLANALTAFADGGSDRRILIHGDGDATSAQIIVSDNGSGIEPSGSRAVGIALARQLVQAHDGRFEQVARKGEGAMIAMFLPR